MKLKLPTTSMCFLATGVRVCGSYSATVSSLDIPLFKKLLKKLLLQYVFYSVDEYYQQNFDDCI